jgi:hypothetical protein
LLLGQRGLHRECRKCQTEQAGLPDEHWFPPSFLL